MFFRLIRVNMTSYNLPSVTLSLHRDRLSLLFVPYRGIFLPRFLITVVLNTISSLHTVFLLCVRVGWCDVCTEFTNLIGRCRCKWDVTIKYLTRTISIFNRYVFTHWFSHMCLILLVAYMANWRIFMGKSEALLSWLAICLLFSWCYLTSDWWLHKYSYVKIRLYYWDTCGSPVIKCLCFFVVFTGIPVVAQS